MSHLPSIPISSTSAESAHLFLGRKISNKNTSLFTAGRLLIQTPDWLINCFHALGVFPGSLSLEGLLWPTFRFVFLKCDCVERLNQQQGAAGADAWSRDGSRDAADRLWRHPLMCDSCEWQHVLLLLPFSLMLLRSITVSMSDMLLLMRSAWRFFFFLFFLFFFLPQQDGTWKHKKAGKSLIWVIAWVIVGVLMTEKEGLCA